MFKRGALDVYSDKEEIQEALPLMESSKNSAMSSVLTESELWANMNSCHSEKHDIKYLCSKNTFNNERTLTEGREVIEEVTRKNSFSYPFTFCEWWP